MDAGCRCLGSRLVGGSLAQCSLRLGQRLGCGFHARQCVRHRVADVPRNLCVAYVTSDVANVSRSVADDADSCITHRHTLGTHRAEGISQCTLQLLDEGSLSVVTLLGHIHQLGLQVLLGGQACVHLLIDEHHLGLQVNDGLHLHSVVRHRHAVQFQNLVAQVVDCQGSQGGPSGQFWSSGCCQQSTCGLQGVERSNERQRQLTLCRRDRLGRVDQTLQTNTKLAAGCRLIQVGQCQIRRDGGSVFAAADQVVQGARQFRVGARGATHRHRSVVQGYLLCVQRADVVGVGLDNSRNGRGHCIDGRQGHHSHLVGQVADVRNECCRGKSQLLQLLVVSLLRLRHVGKGRGEGQQGGVGLATLCRGQVKRLCNQTELAGRLGHQHVQLAHLSLKLSLLAFQLLGVGVVLLKERHRGLLERFHAAEGFDDAGVVGASGQTCSKLAQVVAHHVQHLGCRSCRCAQTLQGGGQRLAGLGEVLQSDIDEGQGAFLEGLQCSFQLGRVDAAVRVGLDVDLGVVALDRLAGIGKV